MLMGGGLAWNITARSTLLQSKETLMTDTPIEDLADAVKANPDPKLQDQGDIAADDAGASAIAARVTKSAGVQGQDVGD